MLNILEKEKFEKVIALVDKNIYEDDNELLFKEKREIEKIVLDYAEADANKFNTVFRLLSKDVTLQQYISKRFDYKQYRKLIDTDKEIRMISELLYDNQEQFSRKMKESFGYSPSEIRSKRILVEDNKLEFPFTLSDVEHPLYRAMKSVAIDIDDDDAACYIEEYAECSNNFSFTSEQIYSIAKTADVLGIELTGLVEACFDLYCDEMMSRESNS